MISLTGSNSTDDDDVTGYTVRDALSQTSIKPGTAGTSASATAHATYENGEVDDNGIAEWTSYLED